MRAIQFSKFGSPANVLQLVDIPQPTPGPEQIRLRLTHRSINPSDLLTVSGQYGRRCPLRPALSLRLCNRNGYLAVYTRSVWAADTYPLPSCRHRNF